MIRITGMSVMRESDKLFDLGVYTITIDDEAGGEFLVVEEQQDDGQGKIRIDRESWLELRQAIDQMMAEVK